MTDERNELRIATGINELLAKALEGREISSRFR